MAKNRKFANGKQLALAVTFPANPASGDPVIAGNLAGVALEPKRAVDGLTAIDFEGVYTLPISTACAVGDVIGGTKASPVVLSAYATTAAAVAAGAVIFGHACSVLAAAGNADVRLGR
jgi:predicted RecA/RadA family phage recombinase